MLPGSATTQESRFDPMPHGSHHNSLRIVCPHCVRRQRYPTPSIPLYCYPWCRLTIELEEDRDDYRLTA